MTYLACTNVEGSENFPLLVTGRSQQPKCFGSEYPESLGIMYRHNSKALINALIFFEWLEAFDSSVGEMGDLKSLLLIDNAACH